MKVGDVVMYTNSQKYAMFFGAIGFIEQCSKASEDGEIDVLKHHIRVKWLTPVRYFGRFPKFSDFPASSFSAAEK